MTFIEHECNSSGFTNLASNTNLFSPQEQELIQKVLSTYKNVATNFVPPGSFLTGMDRTNGLWTGHFRYTNSDAFEDIRFGDMSSSIFPKPGGGYRAFIDGTGAETAAKFRAKPGEGYDVLPDPCSGKEGQRGEKSVPFGLLPRTFRGSMSGGKAAAMTDWTTFVVGQFISGRAFFFGMALCLIGCFLKLFFKRTSVRSVAEITLLTGVVLVILSAAPFSLWMYGVFFALLAWVLFRLGRAGYRAEKPVYLLPLLLLLAQSLLMVGMEIRCSMALKIPPAKGDTLFVVGDSISMGADPPGKNWPQLLGDSAKLKVQSFSAGGAKVESALVGARRIHQDDALVILEIGGNDLLSGTSIPKFREDLEKMMGLVCGSRRIVAMVELPLPPFYNRYGMVQRALAREHGVTLIPKRFIADVMNTPGATVDGLHFSNTGHILFARALSRMLTRPNSGTNAPSH